MEQNTFTRRLSITAATVLVITAVAIANPLPRRREFVRNRGSADLGAPESLAGLQLKKRSDRSAEADFGRGERYERSFIDDRDIGMGRYGALANLRLKRESTTKEENVSVNQRKNPADNEVIDADLIDLKIQQIVDKIRDQEASDREHQNMNRRRRWNRAATRVSTKS